MPRISHWHVRVIYALLLTIDGVGLRDDSNVVLCLANQLDEQDAALVRRTLLRALDTDAPASGASFTDRGREGNGCG